MHDLYIIFLTMCIEETKDCIIYRIIIILIIALKNGAIIAIISNCHTTLPIVIELFGTEYSVIAKSRRVMYRIMCDLSYICSFATYTIAIPSQASF